MLNFFSLCFSNTQLSWLSTFLSWSHQSFIFRRCLRLIFAGLSRQFNRIFHPFQPFPSPWLCSSLSSSFRGKRYFSSSYLIDGHNWTAALLLWDWAMWCSKRSKGCLKPCLSLDMWPHVSRLIFLILNFLLSNKRENINNVSANTSKDQLR